MRSPAGYELRAATGADLQAVAEVLIADDLDDAGQTDLDADFLRDEWSRSGFDPATDAWVVTRAGIVGYAECAHETPGVVESWGVVHPEHRGRGLGSLLLDRIEERAASMLAGHVHSRLRNAINANDSPASAMLLARGFRIERHFWHMQIDLHEPPDRGRLPAGIEIGAVDPTRDLATVHEVIEEAFVDEWSYRPKALGQWSAEHVGSPSFDPTLWLLALEEGRPVGALTANVWGDRGWVNEVGVRRGWRGRGIGAALLRRSFAEFGRRGLPRVMLNVDAGNPTGATALYERVGMRIVKRWDLYEKTAGGGHSL